jgi:hypothetical protein
MGEEVEWLSFRLIKGKNGLEAHLKGKAWKSLAEHLEECHLKDDSPQRAIETINGWVGSMGACFSHTDISEAHARISSLASNLAFDEIPSLEEISHTWLHAHRMWCRSRRVGTQR